MPIYEYQCQECGQRMEALQKISAAPLTDCPACHRAGLVKLVSASSFRLKGGGWYETDFKTGAKRHGTQDGKEAGVPVADTAAGTTNSDPAGAVTKKTEPTPAASPPAAGSPAS